MILGRKWKKNSTKQRKPTDRWTVALGVAGVDKNQQKLAKKKKHNIGRCEDDILHDCDLHFRLVCEIGV